MEDPLSGRTTPLSYSPQDRTVAAAGEALIAKRSLPERDSVLAVGASLFLLAAAATALRLHDLGDGLWFDEIDTLVHYARLPFAQILTTFDSKNQHLLYSVFAHGSFAVFGESAWALRLPAAILGVLSLLALAWFGSIVTSRREAVAATLLLTFSYHHVWFSQNARGYTALLLATLVSSGLLLKIASSVEWSWRLSAGYGVAMALAVYTHATAVLVVVGHAIWWAVLAIRARERRVWPTAWASLASFALAGALSLLLYAPVLPQFFSTLLTPASGGVATEWKNPLWLVAETVRVLGRGLPGGWLALLLGLAVGIMGLVSYARRNLPALGLVLLPVAVTAVVMVAMRQNLWPRFFFFAAGFGAMIVVRGFFVIAERLWPARSSRLGLGAVAALALASATTVSRAWAPKQDYLGARAFIAKELRPGDAVVTVDMTTMPYRTYHRLDWLVASSERELASIEQKHGRTWVVLTFPPRLSSVQPEVWERLQRSYVKTAEFPGTVGGGSIIVMVRG